MKSIIYIGMDVHKNTYSLCAYDKNITQKVLETKCGADVKLVIKFMESVKELYLNAYGEVVDVKTGYEAGCLGYSLYHELNNAGIDCDILAPTTMARSSKEKIRKNDKLDAYNIATNLANNSYKAVYVPCDGDVEVKEYIRMKADFKLALKKVKQQMNAFILKKGFRYEGKSRWTEAHLKWVKSLELSEVTREVLDEYLAQYHALKDKIDRFTLRIEEFSKSEAYEEEISKLKCFKGIDTASAMAIHVEISDFNRFPNARAFSSYLGLTPGEDSSGDKSKYLSITKQGNSLVRSTLVECSQALVRGSVGNKGKALIARQRGQETAVIDYADKAIERLQRKFNKLIYRGVARNKAVTAVARELACFIWGMETGNISRC